MISAVLHSFGTNDDVLYSLGTNDDVLYSMVDVNPDSQMKLSPIGR